MTLQDDIAAANILSALPIPATVKLDAAANLKCDGTA